MSTSSAEDLLKQAEKKASGSSGWFSNAQTKLEEAAELFKAAANKLRIQNRFEDAGNAYMRAAQTEVKAGELDYAANTYFEAHKCFKQSRPERGYWSGARMGKGMLLSFHTLRFPTFLLCPSQWQS